MSTKSFISSALTLAIFCLGCKSNSLEPYPCGVGQKKPAVDLPLVFFGVAKEPSTTPFDSRPELRSAYLDGFKTGWKIIQDLGRGSSVVPPTRFFESKLLSDTWYKGIADGKIAAYKEIPKKQDSGQETPKKDAGNPRY